MSPPTSPLPKIKRIAILGGGPSGISTLARLQKFHPTHFQTIDLFEQRDAVGGIWNYTAETQPLVDRPGGVNGNGNGNIYIPVDSPRGEYAAALGAPLPGDVFPSPMYPSLRANIPTPLMEWGDWGFGEGTVLFPGHGEVLGYVRGYYERLGVEEVRRGDGKGDMGGDGGVRVWLGKRVRRVEKVGGRGWRVVVGDVGGEEDGVDEGEERWYDAVVVATGRYTVPYIPDIPGLKEWVLAGKGERVVEHSREFREVEGRYKGKRILLVGSSISAADICRLLLPLGPSLPIFQSMRTPPPSPPTPDILPVSTISHIDPLTGAIHLHSHPNLPPTTSATLTNIDLILFCTGYHLTAPFLPANHPSTPSPRGTYIPHLLLHSISALDPTLAWIGLAYRVAPFPITAAQAAVLGRLWAGEITLEEVVRVDDEQEREFEDGAGEVDEKGEEGKIWERVKREMREGGGREEGALRHLLTPPRDWMYADRLVGLCRAADERRGGGEKEGGQRKWVGDVYGWSEYQKKVRMRLGEVRARYDKAVEEGRKVTRFEEIGMGYEDVMGENAGVGGGGVAAGEEGVSIENAVI